MFIANGKVNNPISNMIKNKKYTHFLPKISTLDAKKMDNRFSKLQWNNIY